MTVGVVPLPPPHPLRLRRHGRFTRSATINGSPNGRLTPLKKASCMKLWPTAKSSTTKPTRNAPVSPPSSTITFPLSPRRKRRGEFMKGVIYQRPPTDDEFQQYRFGPVLPR